MKRRLLSLTMALALCLSLLPVTAGAGEQVSYIECSWNKDTNTVTETSKNVANYTTIEESTTAWDSTTTGGWYVAQGEVTINQRVTVTGDVHLILADGCTLTVNGGIQVAENNSLTIYGQSGGTGKLTVTCRIPIEGGYDDTHKYDAAIGGNGQEGKDASTGGIGTPGGTVTIHGGTVTAQGRLGAGIGGGSGWSSGDGGTVTIYGGTVTASSDGGAGIGGGGNNWANSYGTTIGGTAGAGGTVTIHGGTVTAKGGELGAGIGGGSGNTAGAGGTVTITGGTVTAQGDLGAGIGGGNGDTGGAGGTVTITGGTVTATGDKGAGIGGGSSPTKGAGGTVTITGGTVTATSKDGAGIGSGYVNNKLGSAGTFSTSANGTNGNAVIFASGKDGEAIQADDDTTGWRGVIFQGDSGLVYGTPVTPTEDFTIPSGKTLTIASGQTLNIPEGVTLTNEGTLTVSEGGTLTVSEGGKLTVEQGGTLEGSVNGSTPPTISGQPTAQTVTEGSTATFTVTSSAGEDGNTNTLTYQWQQSTDSGGTWTDISGATSASYTTEATTTSMSGDQYRCVVTGAASRVSVVSSAAALTVNPKPTYTLTIQASPAEGGTATGGGTYTEGATVTLTATPHAGYHFTGWTSETVAVADASSASTTFSMPAGDVTVTANFARNSSGGGGGSRPDPSPSDQATDKIEDAQEGDTVEVKLPEGKTTLDKEVFEELAGRDVTLVLDLGDGVSWTVNGLDIPETADFADLDLGVSMDSGSVPVDVINAITGEIGTLQMTLAHDGDFGFTLTLSAPLGEENEGYWANLYYFDEDAETLTFQTSAKIDEDGSAALVFTHASQYVIVIDDRDHTPKDFSFVDVSESDWFYEAVDYVFQRDLMNGTDPTHFTPDGTSSRAMVATILWRMAGQPQADDTLSFTDIPASAWYTEAVRWAAETGIVTGYSDTKFGPDDPVTREQFAVMLYRYAQTLDEGFTGSWSFPLDFPDAAQVSDYAYEALCWLTMENVINGMEDGKLHPQGTATRAQLATMLMRFDQSLSS